VYLAKVKYAGYITRDSDEVSECGDVLFVSVLQTSQELSNNFNESSFFLFQFYMRVGLDIERSLDLRSVCFCFAPSRIFIFAHRGSSGALARSAPFITKKTFVFVCMQRRRPNYGLLGSFVLHKNWALRGWGWMYINATLLRCSKECRMINSRKVGWQQQRFLLT
jgi:hypothetical protein